MNRGGRSRTSNRARDGQNLRSPGGRRRQVHQWRRALPRQSRQSGRGVEASSLIPADQSDTLNSCGRLPDLRAKVNLPKAARRPTSRQAGHPPRPPLGSGCGSLQEASDLSKRRSFSKRAQWTTGIVSMVASIFRRQALACSCSKMPSLATCEWRRDFQKTAGQNINPSSIQLEGSGTGLTDAPPSVRST